MVSEAVADSKCSMVAVVAEAVEDVYNRREQVSGLKMVYEPEYLRFFQARFEPAG